MAGRSFASGHSCVRRPVPASPVWCRGARTNRPRDLRPGKGRRGPVPGSCRGRRDLGARGKRPRCIRRAMHPARDRAGPCGMHCQDRVSVRRGVSPTGLLAHRDVRCTACKPDRPCRDSRLPVGRWGTAGLHAMPGGGWRRPAVAAGRRRVVRWRPQLAAGAAPDCCSSCSCSARSRNSSASAMRRSTSSRSSVSFAFMRSRMFL